MWSLGEDLPGVVNESYSFLNGMDGGTLPKKNAVVSVQSWDQRQNVRKKLDTNLWECDSAQSQKGPPSVVYDRSAYQSLLRRDERNQDRWNQNSKSDYRESERNHDYRQKEAERRRNISPRGNVSEEQRNIRSNVGSRQNRNDLRREEEARYDIRNQGSPSNRRPGYDSPQFRQPTHPSNYHRQTSIASTRSSHYNEPIYAVPGRHDHYYGNDRDGGHLRTSAKERIETYNAERNKEPSYLMQRTNAYLGAVDSMKTKTKDRGQVNDDHYRASKRNENQVTSDYAHSPRQKITPANRSERISAKDLFSTNAPPPPPMPTDSIGPKPPPMPLTPGKLTPANAMAGGAWVHDIKEGSTKLKKAPKRDEASNLKRTELEPESEPQSFKEKLNRILQRQVADIRWPQVKPGAKNNPPENKEDAVVKSSATQSNIKTLSKTALRDKLEDVLEKGPQNRASLHGVFDMNEKRKEALTKLRTSERRYNEPDEPEEDYIVEYPDDNESRTSSDTIKRHPDYYHRDPTVQRQRMLMGSVVSTINLRGVKTDHSHI